MPFKAILEQVTIIACRAVAPWPTVMIIWQFANVTHPAAYNPGSLVCKQ